MQHIIHWFHNGGNLSNPHFITYPIKSTATIIVDTDYEMSEGDTVENKHSGSGVPVFTGTIKKIIERRPAKGDWKTRPDFIHIEI